MHLGLMMECDYRQDRTQREAFDEAFVLAETAETEGYDGVWFAERHFAPPGGTAPYPLGRIGPVVWATAIAAHESATGGHGGAGSPSGTPGAHG